MKKGSKAEKTKTASLYTLELFILNGPISEKFVKKNPVVSRTIQIRGSQTLEQLHDAIFKAFDRWEEHMYEFQVGGKGPMDKKARRYGLTKLEDTSFFGDSSSGDVAETKIESLGLKKGGQFGYWFDFGDDWWHQIDVIAIEDVVPGGRYPKVIKRLGQSPPQYMDDE